MIEMMLAVRRPYFAMIVGTMKLPATRAKPRMDAVKESHRLVSIVSYRTPDGKK